jgi:hypothetical protein
MRMVCEAFLDKARLPGEQEILAALGCVRALWLDLCKFIEVSYGVSPEPWYFTKQRGWSVRYRRGKKTLCYLFPEENTFAVLIVLGREELRKADLARNRLNGETLRVLDTTEQYHDGRWLWLQAAEESDVQSFKALLEAKSKPKAAAGP